MPRAARAAALPSWRGRPARTPSQSADETELGVAAHDGHSGQCDGYGNEATIFRYSSSVNARNVCVVTFPSAPVARAMRATV